MKVSKPVLIFGIVVLLLAGYIQFFTGKKKTVVPAAPSSKISQPARPVQEVAAKPAIPQTSGSSVQQDAAPNVMKPNFDKVKGAWVRNPFVLPSMEQRKKETTSAVRLLGILERGNDRLAIIDHEVVGRGDMVGDERIIEIEKDKVVLVRNKARRTISLMPADNMIHEKDTKMTDSERGK